jgi:DNA-binding MarR family transcriptional regulator
MKRDRYEKEIILRLFNTSNALQTYIDKLLVKDNLTAKQFFMMIVLGTFPSAPRIGELSEVFGTSRQNVKQVVLKLQKQGYVALNKDEVDSRVLRIVFTKKASTYWEERNGNDASIIKELFSTLSTIELEGFLKGLLVTSQQIKKLQE